MSNGARNIVAISVPFPGAKRPLEEGAKLGLWDFILLEGPRIVIPNAETYILAAWGPAYEQLLRLSSRSKLGVLWTSSVGEMDFTPVEQGYLNRLLKDDRISFIWFGDPSLAMAYPEKGFYLPYPLKVDEADPPYVEKREIATLFCPTGPKKNILNQLVAMKLVQRDHKLTLHTNVEGYEVILEELDCVRHPWLPEVEYRELIASARINLAVSHCETFNYQVAEALTLGTSSVISATIPLPGHIVLDPNNPHEIALTIGSILVTAPYYIDMATIHLKSLREREKRDPSLSYLLKEKLERFMEVSTYG